MGTVSGKVAPLASEREWVFIHAFRIYHRCPRFNNFKFWTLLLSVRQSFVYSDERDYFEMVEGEVHVEKRVFSYHLLLIATF